MKILVIGGSYFLGRVFTIFARKKEEVEISLFNRGTYSFGDEMITEYKGDRHDMGALSKLSAERFDVIVDFCGYQKGEVRTVFECLKCDFKQYIFISTVDALKHKTGKNMDEGGPYEDVLFAGEVGEYIRNKVELEKELFECCSHKGCAYTVIRPVSLYGPYNYAPREAQYIKYIIDGKTFAYPSDAPATFQMLYVKDAAVMILALCGNPEAYHKCFHLAPEERISYLTFLETLCMVSDLPIKAQFMPLQEVLAQKKFLPYPALADESEYYQGIRISQLTGISYTPFVEGMEHTYRFYKRSYQKKQ